MARVREYYAVPKRNFSDGFVVCIIVFCGVFLRLIFLGRTGLSLDEIIYFSALTSDTSFEFSRYAVMSMYQSPFFCIIGQYWLKFVDIEWTIRILPFIFGVCSLGLVYPLCRQIMSRSGAMLSLVFLALCPYHIYISQRFLPYSMLLFFLILNMHFFFLTGRKGVKWYMLAGFILSAVCAMSSHLYAVTIIPAQLFFFYFVPYKKNRFPFTNWIICCTVIFCLWLILLGVNIAYLDIAVTSDRSEFVTTSLKHIFYMIFIVPYGMIDAGNIWLSALYIVVGIAIVFCMYRGVAESHIYKKGKSTIVNLQINSDLICFCGFLFVIQLIIPLIIFEIIPVFYSKQSHITGIMLVCAILMGSGLQRHNCAPKLRIFMTSLIGLIFIGALVNYYHLRFVEEQLFMLIR